ncbi:hypothetical protein MPDQ_003990 [Monascus purpureus]|uniref:Transcription factor domain-containing protein n=1 Tax=Monascus purpureus TaxID=5098 RepID=A0A507R399_MONPU|nr:hypothetical protein MPDQ_003990 [Monascus purpureus]
MSAGKKELKMVDAFDPSKRKGLEKALHQIEQAIKRPRADASGSDATDKVISSLQSLLDMAQGHSLQNEASYLSDGPERHHGPLSSPENSMEDNLALDDAENPLQLLARASDLQLSPPGTCGNAANLPLPSVSPSRTTIGHLQRDYSGAKSFFAPVKAHLDTGPDLDPMEVGLVTLDETEALFSFFYQNLAHTRWGLDPLVHTIAFVRSQSAFLFTSILAASALFVTSAAALSKRLSKHCRFLAQYVISQRRRSIEIVLAFMVNVPWMPPGNYLGDDDTCSYIAMALTIALDLSLNKIVTPSSFLDGGILKRLARADCIDAKRVLHMDGFVDVDSDSEWGRRLIRRRERAWIALFVVERGVCLARGRSYTVPRTALIDNCDRWHISDIADPRDGPMTSMAVLRRDLDGLLENIKSRCDSYQVTTPGSEAAQLIKSTIERFYDQWYATWPLAIGEGSSHMLPPYVEILVIHTKLSTYSGVINHPTAPLEVKRFFHAAGLSSALNVMRAAIQGESQLKSMPNNTVIMISFAACSALSLAATPADSRSNLAPSIQNLIEETAGVLERIGATPSHRNGASVLYGRFLRMLIRRSFPQTQTEPGPQRIAQSGSLHDPLAMDRYNRSITVSESQYSPDSFWTEPLHFSAMSDHQIVDAVNRVNRAGTAFGRPIPDIQLDNIMNWDWLDLPNVTEFGF